MHSSIGGLAIIVVSIFSLFSYLIIELPKSLTTKVQKGNH